MVLQYLVSGYRWGLMLNYFIQKGEYGEQVPNNNHQLKLVVIR